MTLAIIIPTFNRKEYLQKILYDIDKQVHKLDDLNVKVIVVNDGSKDGTEEMILKYFPSVKLVQGNGNWWYTKSINQGIREGQRIGATHFLLMNDDTTIEEYYLDNLINDYKTFSNHEIILGSISLTVEEPLRIFFSGIKAFKIWRWKSIYYHPPFVSYSPLQTKGIHQSIYLPGRGMLFSAKVNEKIGFLEEKFLQYGSDTEFCLRARKNGINSYISWNAKIFSHHKVTGSGTTFLAQSFKDYFQSYLKPESRNYWYKYWLLMRENSNILIVPLLFSFVLSVNTINFLNKKLHQS